MLLKICGVMGVPNQTIWAEGMRLAAAISYKFPNVNVTPLSSLVRHASSDALGLTLSCLICHRVLDIPHIYCLMFLIAVSSSSRSHEHMFGMGPSQAPDLRGRAAASLLSGAIKIISGLVASVYLHFCMCIVFRAQLISAFFAAGWYAFRCL
jgi:hypothetical protein